MRSDPSRRLLADRRFRRIWIVGLLCSAVRWLELLAFGIYAVDATGSPALVALLVVLRFLPLALFGVFIGAVADEARPARLLSGGVAAIGAASAVMLALALAGALAYWHVAVAAFLSGAFWASDLPLRRKMIGDAVDAPRLARGMALDGATSNGMRLVGPLLGGALYQTLGIEGVFALATCVYVAAFGLALTLRDAPPKTPPAVSSIGALMMRSLRGAGEAFAFARASPDVMRILAVTVVFNIWGFPYLAMIPVIGLEDLGVSSAAVGAMTAIEGGFALIAALAMARSTPERAWRPIYFYGTAGLVATVFALGVAPNAATLVAGLVVGGLCAGAFATMQSTLIYSVAPPAMRGRFLGLMTICIGAGVVGFANMGLTAELFGAANALWIVALQGAVPLLLISRGWVELRRGGAA